MQLFENWCSVDGNLKTEPVSMYHVTEEIRKTNSSGYYHGVLGDTFIVYFAVWLKGGSGKGICNP